jgi:hypothetical protein
MLMGRMTPDGTRCMPPDGTVAPQTAPLLISYDVKDAAGNAAATRRRRVYVVGPRLWISRTLLKSLLNFKDRVEIPYEFQVPCEIIFQVDHCGLDERACFEADTCSEGGVCPTLQLVEPPPPVVNTPPSLRIIGSAVVQVRASTAPRCPHPADACRRALGGA